MLKYAMEILLSESSVVTTYYFGWSMSSVSIFLFCLGLTVLPVNLVVGSYISKYGLEDVFCFASDYPNVEGGKNPMGRFADSLSGHPEKIFEKFFVENGELLLPA